MRLWATTAGRFLREVARAFLRHNANLGWLMTATGLSVLGAIGWTLTPTTTSGQHIDHGTVVRTVLVHSHWLFAGLFVAIGVVVLFFITGVHVQRDLDVTREQLANLERELEEAREAPALALKSFKHILAELIETSQMLREEFLLRDPPPEPDELGPKLTQWADLVRQSLVREGHPETVPVFLNESDCEFVPYSDQSTAFSEAMSWFDNKLAHLLQILKDAA